MTVADPLPIPTRGPIDGRLALPGSKSLSNRALLVAALADGTSQLRGVLDSDDIRIMERALTQMGVSITAVADQRRVAGRGGALGVPDATIDVGASGTAARFLTATTALVPGECRIDGTARMRQRPIDDLVDAMSSLGVDIEIEGEGGCPPVRCRGGEPFGGEVQIDGSRSSQYVSALLLIAPRAGRDVTLRLRNGVLVSRPYVDLTLDLMGQFGAEARWVGDDALTVVGRTGYRGRDYLIEPDASTAAYFFGAAAITGGSVAIEGLPGASRQADMGLLGVLEQMGCGVLRKDDCVEVRAPASHLEAVDVDMNAMPDAVLAAAVIAAFARGTTRIRNVANLRIKESDRLAALETELNRLGATAIADADSLTITPGPMHGARIATYDDHRMAMAFSLAGLRVEGVEIEDPGCVSKSWPGYFDALLGL